MHTDLRRILASERVGSFEKSFLDERLVILSKQLTDNGYSFWAGDTYNSDGAHAMRCSDGADSVVI